MPADKVLHGIHDKVLLITHLVGIIIMYFNFVVLLLLPSPTMAPKSRVYDNTWTQNKIQSITYISDHNADTVSCQRTRQEPKG